MKKVYAWFFWVCLAHSAQGQELVQSTIVEELSAIALTAQTGFVAKNAITVYQVSYLTTGINGMPDTASGLIVLPVTDKLKGIVAYQHGTTDGPTDVPSNLNSEAGLVKALAGQGYVGTAADYLGLGSSRGFHPYVHADTEASAGVDLLLAGLDLAKMQGFDSIEHVFVTGYSQGGHAAMAMAQAIQEGNYDGLEVTAAAPMSGPYDLSTVMEAQGLTDTIEYLFPSYMIYLILGYQEVYGNIYENLEDVFIPEVIPAIRTFYEGSIGLSALNGSLLGELANYPVLSPGYLLTDAFRTSIQSDTLHPLQVALADNDTYKWVPEFPMRMFYCMQDDQVNFNNSLVAEAFMQSNGAEDVEAKDVFSAGDHGACVLPAVLSTLAFFDQFAMTTALKGRDIEFAKVYPNPASDYIRVELPGDYGSYDYTIYDHQGQLIASERSVHEVVIDVSSYPSGIYHLLLEGKSGRFQNNFIIHR